MSDFQSEDVGSIPTECFSNLELYMNNSNSATGLGIPGVLFLLFTVLKLTGNIDWSWVWVLSPLWIPFATIFVVALLIAVVRVIDKST